MAASPGKQASPLLRQNNHWSCQLWIPLLVLLTHTAFAELPRGSVTSFALGGTPNLLQPSPMDISLNPALSCYARWSFEGVASRLYELSDFDIASGAAAYRFRSVAFGFSAIQLVGADYYSERNLLGVFSVAPIHFLRFGVGLEHQQIEFGEGYGKTSAIAISLGAIFVPTDRAALAISMDRINRPRFEPRDDRLPLRGHIDATFVATPSLTLLLSHQLDENYPDRFCIGQQIAIVKDFDLLLGLSTEPFEISGGFGLKLRGFNFEYAYRNNVYLGGTHRVGLRYSH